MAKVWYNKAKGQWCSDVTVSPGRRRRYYLGRDKRSAQKKLRSVLAAVEGAWTRSPVGPGLSYEAVANEFLENVEVTRTRATYDMHRDGLRLFAERVAGREIGDIGPADLEAFKRDLIRHGYSPTTVNHRLGSVRRLFNWATSMDHISGHKMDRVKNVPKAERDVRWLRTEEIKKLLGACQPDFHDVLVVYLNTGMRPAELRRLTWADVDLERGYIAIRGGKTSRTVKNPRVRYVPINAAVRSVLGSTPHADGPVFRNSAGRPYTKDGAAQRLRRAAGRAGLSGVSVHTLRHTFASHLTQEGTPLAVVSELLGHTSWRTTQIYAHLAPEHLRSAVDLLAFDAD